MKFWSSKPINYSILKAFKAFFIEKINIIYLGGKLVNYVFNGYPIGGKGYELWEVESGIWRIKVHHCRCIMFSESYKWNKSKRHVYEDMVNAYFPLPYGQNLKNSHVKKVWVPSLTYENFHVFPLH